MGTETILMIALELNHLKSMYDYWDQQRYTHRNTPFKEPRTHDDVIKLQHFTRYWPFVRGIHRSRWIPRTIASDAELWYFLWSASE